MDDLLTTSEVAEEMGIPVQRVQYLIHEKRLPGIKHGGQWRVYRADFNEFREYYQFGGAPEPEADYWKWAYKEMKQKYLALVTSLTEDISAGGE